MSQHSTPGFTPVIVPMVGVAPQPVAPQPVAPQPVVPPFAPYLLPHITIPPPLPTYPITDVRNPQHFLCYNPTPNTPHLQQSWLGNQPPPSPATLHQEYRTSYPRLAPPRQYVPGRTPPTAIPTIPSPHSLYASRHTSPHHRPLPTPPIAVNPMDQMMAAMTNAFNSLQQGGEKPVSVAKPDDFDGNKEKFEDFV
ncbi:hypothetical protein JAAARDRAFT_51779 [Jaapia argillacea MUCL 33604]|uniref:Uncharacterized protein n=1 Tax=Jaapia argillacea MUCL 33604 TaxID=933084 RepID=A0A067PFZ0_9AGAM|nr:hypothetical protein JAAARDRAFT_51779 [Jaapia argillacea MUCL 33604]